MIQMFKQFFAMFSTLFTAGEKFASTIDNFATIGEEMSGSYLDKTRAERAAQLKLIKAEAKAPIKQIK